MSRYFPLCAAGLLLAGITAPAPAGLVEFTLLTHDDNEEWLPQPTDSTGDHLIQTGDDCYVSGLYRDGSFSFNFMDKDAAGGGSANGVHPLTGTLEMDVDLASGGPITVESLQFDGKAYASATSQHLVKPGDAATGPQYGNCVNGSPNNGSYDASAASNWRFSATIDWYYDVPFAGPNTIDLIFDDYPWTGFLIPVTELTPSGLAGTAVEDWLGYYTGDFESWLLEEVEPRLPGDAEYLLFAQGEGVVAWSQTPSFESGIGIARETIIGYTAAPEPATLFLAGLGLGVAAVARRRAGRP